MAQFMSKPAYQYIGGHVFGAIFSISNFKVFTDKNDIFPVLFRAEKTPKGRSGLHSRFFYILFELKCDLGIAQFWIMGEGNGRLFLDRLWYAVLCVQIIDNHKSNN